jgi:nitroimidazol reductase NimA-like FMN-containing flavoprotein (pyridoxamine 5'-phosphate oxidase superfamily)
MITDPRTWLEILGTEACWDLLDNTSAGRLAVVTDNRPQIFPVNYAIEDRTIVFRTEAGSKLAALDGNPNVCFEIDRLDVAEKKGWSVLVQGQASAVRRPDELHTLDALHLEFWATGDKPNYVRITPTVVSGRRIHPHGAQN